MDEPDYGDSGLGGGASIPGPDDLPEPRYVKEVSPPPMSTPAPSPGAAGDEGLPQYGGGTDDYAERLYRAPTPKPGGAPIPPPPPPPVAEPSGPGEYTRIINSMQPIPVVPPPAAPEPPAQEPAAVDDTSKKSMVVFIVALVLIVVAAVALVIAVAMAG